MYKVGYEDPQFALTQDPWHKVVQCKSGHICPGGGSKLWACTDNRRRKAAADMLSGDMPCVVVMDGDDGINAEFDVKDWKQFFDLMGAKRK